MLHAKRYTITKSKNKYTYCVFIKDMELNHEYLYYSNKYFNTESDCKLYIDRMKANGVKYELICAKNLIINEIETSKFSEFMDKLTLFFMKCQNIEATTLEWSEIKKMAYDLAVRKEITDVEYDQISNRITYYFKNQGKAVDLKDIVEKINQKKELKKAV